LIAHILYHNPYHGPFFVTQIHLCLIFRVHDSGFSGTLSSQTCATGLKVHGRFGYLMECFFLDVCPKISVKRI
jgi:hypothetical protein